MLHAIAIMMYFELSQISYLVSDVTITKGFLLDNNLVIKHAC